MRPLIMKATVLTRETSSMLRLPWENGDLLHESFLSRYKYVAANHTLTGIILQRPTGQTFFFSLSWQNITIRFSTQKGIFSSYPLSNKNCMSQLHIKNIYCYIFIINVVARCEYTQSRRDTCCSLQPHSPVRALLVIAVIVNI